MEITYSLLLWHSGAYLRCLCDFIKLQEPQTRTDLRKAYFLLLVQPPYSNMRTFTSFITFLNNHSLSVFECFYWGLVLYYLCHDMHLCFSLFWFGPTFLLLPPHTDPHTHTHLVTLLLNCVSTPVSAPVTYIQLYKAYPVAANKLLGLFNKSTWEWEWTIQQKQETALYNYKIIIFVSFSLQTDNTHPCWITTTAA